MSTSDSDSADSVASSDSNSHTVAASSVCPQLMWLPHPAKSQSASRCSSPVQATSSIQIGPTPGPNRPLFGTSEATE